MTFTEQIITIATVVAGTMITRFLPFILFPANKKTPPLVAFLGKVLPTAVMGMLVVYSLKDTQILSGSHGVPEARSTTSTPHVCAAIRVWRMPARQQVPSFPSSLKRLLLTMSFRTLK